MHVYACIVKNDEGTWDVWSTLDDIPIKFAERKARLENALKSDFPIITQDLAEHGLSVRSGAVWDGIEWTGGEPTNRKEDFDGGLFAYICDNTIILTFPIEKTKQPNYDLAKAVFESENTIVKIPEGQTAHSGDIWDGEKFYSKI